MWTVTTVLTLGFLVWQKVSGPTYEVKVKSEVGGVAVRGELLRTHSINGDMPVVLNAGDPARGNPGLLATVVWRRYPTSDAWERLPMTYAAGQFKAVLPRQPMAGKLEYTVEMQADPQLRDPAYATGLEAGDIKYFPPQKKGPAVARFKGDVPPLILILHVSFMILGMFFSTAAGFDALYRRGNLVTLSQLAFGFLLLGGCVLGPVVQKYAFDAYWTGWPNGGDWTDNKLAVGAVVWFLAMLLAGLDARKKGRQGAMEAVRMYAPAARWSAVVAMVAILVIYSIPHSIHGSTFDYATGEHVQRM